MIEEETYIVKTEHHVQFLTHLRELYEALTEDNVPDEVRISKTLDILAAIDTIPIGEYEWTGVVPENIMFIVIDRLYFYQLNTLPILNRGHFSLDYFLEKIVPVIVNRLYIDLLKLIPNEEYEENGTLQTIYKLIDIDQISTAQTLIENIASYRFQALTKIHLAKHHFDMGKITLVENLLYSAMEKEQCYYLLARNPSIIDALPVMASVNKDIAEVLIVQAWGQSCNSEVSSSERNSCLLVVAKLFAEWGETDKVNKIILENMTDPYYQGQANIALMEHFIIQNELKMALVIMSNIILCCRKLESNHRYQLALQTAFVLLKYEIYKLINRYLPNHLLTDKNQIADALVALAEKCRPTFVHLGFLKHAKDWGSPSQETYVKIIELYAKGKLYKMANHNLFNVTHPYYRGLMFGKLAVIYCKHLLIDEMNTSWIQAVAELNKDMELIQKLELYIELIESGYIIGELPAVRSFIEKAITIFNSLKLEEEESKFLLKRLVSIVKNTDLKWAFDIAGFILNKEQQSYFTNELIETFSVNDLTPEVVKQYWQLIPLIENISTST